MVYGLGKNKYKTGPAPLETIDQSGRIIKSLSGFTLIELIIAVSMVGMIILAIVAVDAFSRKMLGSSNDSSKLQSTVSSAILLISKDVSAASGNITIQNSTVIDIRSDDNDNWVSYQFNNNTIQRCLKTPIACSASGDPWTSFAYSISNLTFKKDAESGGMQVAITARKNPSRPFDSNSNPEVSAESVAYSRGARIKP